MNGRHCVSIENRTIGASGLNGSTYTQHGIKNIISPMQVIPTETLKNVATSNTSTQNVYNYTQHSVHIRHSVYPAKCIPSSMQDVSHPLHTMHNKLRTQGTANNSNADLQNVLWLTAQQWTHEGHLGGKCWNMAPRWQPEVVKVVNQE